MTESATTEVTPTKKTSHNLLEDISVNPDMIGETWFRLPLRKLSQRTTPCWENNEKKSGCATTMLLTRGQTPDFNFANSNLFLKNSIRIIVSALNYVKVQLVKCIYWRGSKRIEIDLKIHCFKKCWRLCANHYWKVYFVSNDGHFELHYWERKMRKILYFTVIVYASSSLIFDFWLLNVLQNLRDCT